MGLGKELSDKMSIGRIIFFVIVYILGLFILTIFMFSERLNFVGILAAVLAYLITAPIAMLIGEVCRRFAMPDFIWAEKGTDIALSKLFWMVGPPLVGLLIAGFISYGIAFTLSKSDIEARERQAQEQKDNEYQERLPGIKQSIIDEIPGEYTLTNSHASDDEARVLSVRLAENNSIIVNGQIIKQNALPQTIDPLRADLVFQPESESFKAFLSIDSEKYECTFKEGQMKIDGPWTWRGDYSKNTQGAAQAAQVIRSVEDEIDKKFMNISGVYQNTMKYSSSDSGPAGEMTVSVSGRTAYITGFNKLSYEARIQNAPFQLEYQRYRDSVVGKFRDGDCEVSVEFRQFRDSVPVFMELDQSGQGCVFGERGATLIGRYRRSGQASMTGSWSGRNQYQNQTAASVPQEQPGMAQSYETRGTETSTESPATETGLIMIHVDRSALNIPNQSVDVYLTIQGVTENLKVRGAERLDNIKPGIYYYQATAAVMDSAGFRKGFYSASGNLNLRYNNQKISVLIVNGKLQVN
ncbi:MAG: hypothetical protein KBC66_11235 [Kiritimatiellae bacterium]|jgi:hypothetical protein|nr:hypothetical protein [Kiritimatiellia bacterium]HNU01888.1 hypothetical protein [Acidobacteriota bacterium]